MSPRTVRDPSDLSAILLRHPRSDEEYSFVGPIQLLKSSVHHGRGLVAARDVAVGECLFVSSPTLSANVRQIRDCWKKRSLTEEGVSMSLEGAAERTLVQAMKDALMQKNHTVANSFLALVGANTEDEDVSIDVLLGKDATPVKDALCQQLLSDDGEQLLQIVRRNAFGPDFVTYSAIERRWQQPNQELLPSRILDLYPLAAMINHTCNPNAVRVYTGNVMVVHASHAISAGDEILWSYFPPVLAFPQRQSILSDLHGFVCQCPRCICERPFWDSTSSEVQTLVSLQSSEVVSEAHEREAYTRAIRLLEDEILPSKCLSNELRRYLRVGFMNLYIRYLNGAIVSNETNETLLNLSTQLHFSFCACGTASTEHLSVGSFESFSSRQKSKLGRTLANTLIPRYSKHGMHARILSMHSFLLQIVHLCYDLIARLHTAGNDPSSKKKTLPKLRYWTEQVKRACMTRYGNLGENIDTVRAVMQHSRLVLRNRQGLDQAKYDFI